MGITLYGGVRSPLSILGRANVPLWLNGDKRVDGTLPNIKTLINRASAVGSPTQGVADNQPHLLSVNGKNTADFDAGSAHILRVGSISPVLWSSGITDITLWVTCQNDAQGNDIPIELGLGTTINTGIRLQFPTSGNTRAAINAGGSNKNLDVASAPVGMHLHRINYDGSNIDLALDGTSIGSTAKTGTMTNDCDAIEMGTGLNGGSGQRFDGPIRAILLFLGTPTPAQDLAITTYMMADARIAA